MHALSMFSRKSGAVVDDELLWEKTFLGLNGLDEVPGFDCETPRVALI